jgi:hypothetical protein
MKMSTDTKTPLAPSLTEAKTFRCPPKVLGALDALADRYSISRNALVNQALRLFLAEERRLGHLPVPTTESQASVPAA